MTNLTKLKKGHLFTVKGIIQWHIKKKDLYTKNANEQQINKGLALKHLYGGLNQILEEKSKAWVIWLTWEVKKDFW